MSKGKPSPYLARRAKKFKSVKKDYQHKCLNNPFFRQRQPKQQPFHRPYRSLLRILLILLFLAATVYLVCYSPLFALKQVKIEGLSRIPEDNLSALAWEQSQQKRNWFLGQDKVIFFDTNQLSVTLSEKFSFESLRVYKRWPHTLVISAGERSLAFIWRNQQELSFSDGQGCLVREAAVAETDLGNYPILESISDGTHLDERDCLRADDDYLQAALVLFEKMRDYPDLLPERFLLEDTFNTMKVDLRNGPNILFNFKEDMDKQLNKLAVIRQEKSIEEFQGLEYIDLRYGDRAYFK